MSTTEIVELAVKCVIKRKVKPKPIELVKLVNERSSKLELSTAVPENYDYVTLLVPKQGGGKYDIIVCWDVKNEGDKMVFFGHWNDGVAE